MRRPALPASLAAGLTLAASLAVASSQDTKPAPEPFADDFESAELGSLPDGMMEIDGSFAVAETEGGKALEMAAEPLTENAVLFGPSVKGGATVSAKVLAYKKRRSYPRFGVGLHGISGFRLRVVPSKGELELVKNEEPVKAVPYDWPADTWIQLELSVASDGEDRWKVEARVWPVGAERPTEPSIAHAHEGRPGQGKASLWGTPYSGKVAQFDDISIRPE